jgi:hypothetical protein
MNKYDDDLYAWRDSQRAASSSAIEAKKREEAARQAINEAVAKQVEEGRKAYKDFDDVVLNNPEANFTNAMAAAIIEMPNGQDVAYFLGKNPAEIKRLSKLSERLLNIELGEIRAKVKSTKPPTAAAATMTKAPKPAASVAAKTSKAPTDTPLDGRTQEERMSAMEKRSRENRVTGAWQNSR